MAIEAVINQRAEYWATASVFDQDTRNEISQLLEQNSEVELTDRFYRDLEFGTGGMRGILGAGTARMNIYNIRKATTAFARHLKKVYPQENIKVGISYDSRRYSKEFAQATAAVMAAHGIGTIITKELRPVPMLSFLVREYGCKGGICITASHNPPNYNGYKVYWSQGSQIIPPHDQAVIAEYQAIETYDDLPLMSFEDGLSKGLIKEIGSELDEKYFARVDKLSIKPQGRENFKIVFTPLHGTAGKPIATALARWGFKDVVVVPEQAQPDGNFPTVKFPNPEDPEALQMAVDLARKEGADLVLGTDPDCDRVGIVYKERDGEYVFLNGNQIGCLLIEYVLRALSEESRLPDNPLVVKTIVTTEMQRLIGESYGAHVEDTLTGFKWICDLIEKYESGEKQPYRKYVCGGEESYGFLMDSFVRDKDGIISCCVASEMTAYFKSLGKTLGDALNDLYRKHGLFQEKLHTLTLPGKQGADQIVKMMDQLRSCPPVSIANTPVIKLEDFQKSQSYICHDGNWQVHDAIDLPRSNVLKFYLSDGSVISARPSGTEPKIKFYISVRQEVDPNISEMDLKAAASISHQYIERIQQAFLSFAD